MSINLHLTHALFLNLLFSLKCQAFPLPSCHPNGQAGCISVTHSPMDSRGKGQQSVPFLTSPTSPTESPPRFLLLLQHFHLLFIPPFDW